MIPDTSHIIPTRNRPGLVAASVASILAGDAVPAELIIVDQSAERHPRLGDCTTALGTEVRYLWEPSRGLSRARNAGIRAARHEILSFTDDDIVVPGRWYQTLVGGLADAGPRSAVTGPVVATAADGGAFAPSTSPIEDRAASSPVVHRGRLRRDVLNGGNMAIRASAFRDIGSFDERLGAGSHFPGAEDNDLGFRLLECGYAVVLLPGAVVEHRAWRTSAAYLPLRWSYGRGQGAFFGKHMSRHRRLMAIRLGRSIRGHFRTLRAQVPREPLKASGTLVYVAGLLAGVGEWLLTRPGDS